MAKKEQDFENAILRKEDDMSYLIDIKTMYVILWLVFLLILEILICI